MHLQDVRVEILISLVVFEDNNCFIYLLSRNLGGFVVVLLVCVFLFGCINSSSIQVQIKKKKRHRKACYKHPHFFNIKRLLLIGALIT